MDNNLKEKKEICSFQVGMSNLRMKDVKAVREKIMYALHINTNPSFFYRLNGLITHTQADRWAIEKIFHEYGVTEIWGTI